MNNMYRFAYYRIQILRHAFLFIFKKQRKIRGLANAAENPWRKAPMITSEI